jgi:transposase
LLPPSSVHRVLAYRRPVDMRKQIDGLVSLVQSVLAEDALAGTLYVFLNRRATLMKAVFWDRTGFCLLAKRLEQGRFHVPGDAMKQELSARAFELFLDGIVLGVRKRSTVKQLHDTARESRIPQP